MFSIVQKTLSYVICLQISKKNLIKAKQMQATAKTIKCPLSMVFDFENFDTFL